MLTFNKEKRKTVTEKLASYIHYCLQWMPFEEYAAQPFIQKDELMNNFADICLEKIDRKYSGFTLTRSTSSISGKERYLYLNSSSLLIKKEKKKQFKLGNKE
jgi:hypothetical protein